MNIQKITHTPPDPNGFRVITVGTGAPHYDKDRASACTVVQYKDSSFIVDLGYRSVSRMLDAGMDVFSIPNVFFTHCLHMDHTLDYGYFVCMSATKPQPLNLYGPPGTRQLHESFFTRYEEQLVQHAGHGQRREYIIRETTGDEQFQIGDVTVFAKEVPHIVQDIAYRFEADGKRIVVPGDMQFNEAFISFAADADLIVFDTNTAPSVFMDEMKARLRADGVFPDETRKPGGMAHATLAEIGDMAERARAKAIMLTHFTRGPRIEETVRQISAVYHGPIIVGEDMLAVEIE